MNRRGPARGPLAVLAGLITLYLAVPLVAFVVRLAVSPRRGFHQPGLYPALWLSLSSATIALAIITVFGVPLAYLLARSTSRVATVVGVVVQIPLALPPLMSGIVLIYIVGPYTFLGRLFDRQLTNSRAGVIIAMTFVAAPFLIVAARAAFEAVDQGLLDVAATLGHSEVSRFVRVAVPVAGRGIRAGMLLSWLRAFGEYGAVVVLAYNPTSLPVYTYNQFGGVGLPTTLAPTALAAAVAVAAVVVSRVRLRRRPRREAGPVGPPAPAHGRPAPIRFDVDRRLGAFHLALALDRPVRHLAVLGPSGAGKSVLLRSLAGLYGPGAGQLWCADEALGDVAVERRGVGYVAQGFSLFPHLTVWQQLLFPRGATPEVAAYWLDRLGLAGLEDQLPAQLSGGQRQRVALAQALSGAPRVLLLDEPFSALDVPVRHDLRRLVRELQRETGLSTVLVTHDPEEAGFLSEDVLVISDGVARQVGPSRDVFSHPASHEVARLLGIPNLLVASVASRGAIDCGGAIIRADVADLVEGSLVSWSVRPEHVAVGPRRVSDAGEPGASRFDGTVLDVAYVGAASDLFVSINPDFVVQARSTEPLELAVGDPCAVSIRADAVSLWPAADRPEVVEAPG